MCQLLLLARCHQTKVNNSLRLGFRNLLKGRG